MDNKKQEKVSYSIEQINKIVELLDKVKVSGVTSVTSLAMAYQELNSGEVIKETEDNKIKEGE